ncbi:hypothetical protein AX15_002602 [Amanita polypyramis BW_CC]|nr:hypothetical protein AX15_002602 [Amanita polypyramis BW_CC]
MYHWYHHRPSRLFWFIVGATSATLWIKHRDYRFADGRTYGPCVRQRLLQSATPQQATSVGLRESDPMPHNDTSPAPSPALTTSNVLHTVSRAINSIPLAESWHLGERNQTERWEEDKEKLISYTLRATDAMVEMSESTLDAVLMAIENLKTKIAEHRVQRERQRK